MASLMIKYRKTPTAATTSKLQQEIMKNPIIKLDGSGLIINKIPASIQPTMKRVSTSAGDATALKSTKYALQTIASAGTPLTTFQWQPTAASATRKPLHEEQQQKKPIGAALSALALPPNTILHTTGGGIATRNALVQSNGIGVATSNLALRSPGTTLQVRRPTIYIKSEIPKRTIRTVTLELIEKNPFVHLGVLSNRLSLLKNVICATANVSLLECYVTLKKLRQNEDLSLLAEYFELSEAEVQQMFARTVVKLARYLRYLVRWPDNKKYYDRHKNLPFAFRGNLSHVQSLIECVETEMNQSLQLECNNYKFILCISSNGIISYVSDVYVGHHDDLSIFNVSNFTSVIPKYLSLVAAPGKDIRRKRKTKPSQTDAIEESNLTNIININSSTGTGCVEVSGIGVVAKRTKATGESDSTTDSADESADIFDSDNTEDEPDEDSECGRSLNRYNASRFACELATHQTLSVVNRELTSRKVKDFSIPTVTVEPICRMQIRAMVECLREYKILQPHAITEPMLYQYLSEILVIAAALTNLQR